MRKPAFTISVTSRRHAWNLVWSEALSREELEDEMMGLTLFSYTSFLTSLKLVAAHLDTI